VRSAEARDEALVTLYEADQRRQDPDTGELGRRAADMVSGVWSEREALDAVIGATATGWRVERMPPVDRNVLRIALWELRHRPGTPVPVVISEAVRLAKTYSTARSGGFVNGVLARLAGERRPAEG
jgi:N utilization substance protein B